MGQEKGGRAFVRDLPHERDIAQGDFAHDVPPDERKLLPDAVARRFAVLQRQRRQRALARPEGPTSRQIVLEQRLCAFLARIGRLQEGVDGFSGFEPSVRDFAVGNGFMCLANRLGVISLLDLSKG